MDVLDAHGIAGGVVVQPTSGYLFENSVTLDAIKRGGGRLRAIVRIDPDRAKSDESLLDTPGVAGARLDIIGDGLPSLKHPGNQRLMHALAERKQVLEVQVERDLLAKGMLELLKPYIASLLETFTPARCCWGSDWPFLRAEGRLDYGPELALLSAWLPNAGDRDQVLRTTPRRLFGFDAA